MLNSIFLGAPGSYKVYGIDVNFVDDAQGQDVFGNSWFGRAVDMLLSNSIVRILTFGYLHVFIHEMGHAFATKLQGKQPAVNVYTQTCRGDTSDCGRNTFTALAGPLAGMAFETMKLAGAVAAAILFPPVVGLPLGIFLGTGAAFWLFGELMYALIGGGDWDVIRG